MRRWFIVSIIALFIPLPASASSSSTVSRLDCSEHLAVSFLEAASFSCSGTLSLSGGVISSDSRVEITAHGSLSLDNLSISAPVVQLTSLSGEIAIFEGATISSGTFIAATSNGEWDITRFAAVSGGSIAIRDGAAAIDSPRGAITILQGGDVSVISAVPEPEVYSSMLFGMFVVLTVVRRRKSRSLQVKCSKSGPACFAARLCS